MDKNLKMLQVHPVIYSNNQIFKSGKNFHKKCLFTVGFRQVAFIGKILGLIPLELFKCKHEEFKSHKRLSLSTIYSSVLTLHSFIQFLYMLWIVKAQLQSQKSLITKLEFIRLPIYTFSVFFIYLYFRLNSRSKLVGILSNWKQINVSFSSKIQPHRKYPIFCTLTLFIVLGSSITENLLYDLQYFSKEGRFNENATLLEMYYRRSSNVVISLTPYSPTLAIVTTILSKFSTYVWNTSDIFVVVLCKGLSDLINAFSEYIADKFQNSFLTMNAAEYLQGTNKLRLEFKTVMSLAEEITSFLSPLVATCYFYNIYLMTLHLFRWLDPRGLGDTERSVYVYISFCQFSLRVILVTYHASNVYHSTEKIEEALELVPDELYSQTIERLERQLARNPVGISLFGTFRVTRRFFISVISFLFTTEIVLLQTATANSSPSVKQ